MQTIDFGGCKHVIVKTTGFYLMRITACMGVWAYGCKTKPLIIHKGKESGVINRETGPLLRTTQAKALVNSDSSIKRIN